MTGGMTLRKVSKRYGRHTVVNEVTLGVGDGEILGLVGPNGAGKTTLLRMAAGLIRPTSGDVMAACRMRPGAVRYFGGEHTLPPDVPVRSWRMLWNLSSACAIPRQPLGMLSRGTRQRIGLEAMLASPGMRLLLLDEPWEGLDPDASRWLSGELIRQRSTGTAVVVSSHRIHDLASVSDRCEFLVAGRIVSNALVEEQAVPGQDRASRIYAAFDNARTTTLQPR